MTNRELTEAILKLKAEKRAVILKAEGEKQASITAAEGERESAILRADAVKQQRILEADELRGTYECEILGVEEEYDVLLPYIILQGEVVHDFSVDYCGGLELRCLFSY